MLAERLPLPTGGNKSPLTAACTISAQDKTYETKKLQKESHVNSTQDMKGQHCSGLGEDMKGKHDECKIS